MAEGLSTAASVLAVAACAAETAKLLFKVFYEASFIPDNVRQLLSALTSLNTTLHSLQECSARLSPRWQFPARFCRRLKECQCHLDEWSRKIAKIDGVLQGQHGVDDKKRSRSRRSWQKLKWLAVGEKELSRFLEMIRLYHTEFSLELLTLLIKVQDSKCQRRIDNNHGQDRSGDGNLEEHDASTTPIPYVNDGNLIIDSLCGIPTMSSPTFEDSSTCDAPPHVSPVEERKNNCPRLAQDGELLETVKGSITRAAGCHPHNILVRNIWRFSPPFLDCMFCIGPVSIEQQQKPRSERAVSDNHHVGLGLGVSVRFAKYPARRIYFELLILFSSIFHATAFNILGSFACVNVVPQQASIFEAVRTGSMDRVKQLLAKGQGSVRDVTTHGLSLLHTASGLGFTNLVKYLIELGANVNASDEDGETPLHRATSRNNNHDVARILIENGADIARVSIGNKTALHTFANDTIVGILTSSDTLESIDSDSEGMSISHFLSWSSHITPEIFERGRTLDMHDLWAADDDGRTCLHYAALKGNIDLLEHLLDRASSFELEIKDTHGMTALHYAARSSSASQVISMLLEKHANVDARDCNGHGVLEHAAKWGREDVQQFLNSKTKN